MFVLSAINSGSVVSSRVACDSQAVLTMCTGHCALMSRCGSRCLGRGLSRFDELVTSCLCLSHILIHMHLQNENKDQSSRMRTSSLRHS